MRLTKTPLLKALRGGDRILVEEDTSGRRHYLMSTGRLIAPETFGKVASCLVEDTPGLLPDFPQTLRIAE